MTLVCLAGEFWLDLPPGAGDALLRPGAVTNPTRLILVLAKRTLWFAPGEAPGPVWPPVPVQFRRRYMEVPMYLPSVSVDPLLAIL